MTTMTIDSVAGGFGSGVGMGGTGGGLVRYSASVDPESFAADFPAWEPRGDDLYTSDGVRVDGSKAIRRSDTGAILGVVGSDYVVRSHAQLAADLDALAAPFGGRRNLGPAKVISKGARITAIARLPQEFDGLLSVRGDKRGASLMLRDARDGSRREEASVAVIRFACSNGLLAVAAKSLVASAKHTRAIAWLTPTLDRWARGVESGLRLTGETIHRLDTLRLTDREARDVVAQIANPERKEDGQAKLRADKIIDLVMSADGTYVPASDGSGMIRGIQLLEAATAWDRHFSGQGRSKDPADIAFRRIERLADGEGLGARAWDVLSSFVGGAA
jgi:hypothetical protein